MKGTEANKLCSHDGDILAYLYDEMAVGDRLTFEDHLADCGICIDAFAELSQSRYSVYEWKQIEFDPIPTPRVVIPHETVPSRIEKLQAAFANRAAFAFGGFAALALVAAITAFVLINGSRQEEEVAFEVEPSASPTLTKEPSPSRPVEIVAVETKPEPKPESIRPDASKTVKISANDKPRVRRSRPKTLPVETRIEPLPVLSTLEVEEDESLRLADMFDEIGTSE